MEREAQARLTAHPGTHTPGKIYTSHLSATECVKNAAGVLLEKAGLVGLVEPITKAHYDAAFSKAKELEYPEIDKLEHECGYAISRKRLESAARILACPIKKNPPHWQHGRVVYSIARAYLKGRREPVSLLDCGTAKGFSALCLQWALNDASEEFPLDGLGSVTSVDVLDPKGTPHRNSVLELDGPKTLAQFLEPWPEAKRITFKKQTGIEAITEAPGTIHLAFIDGKHSREAVLKEGQALAKRQRSGDMAIWDDCQIEGVSSAVALLREFYSVQYVTCCSYRTYAIGTRR